MLENAIGNLIFFKESDIFLYAQIHKKISFQSYDMTIVIIFLHLEYIAILFLMVKIRLKFVLLLQIQIL